MMDLELEITEDDKCWRGVHVSQFQTSLNRYQFPKLIYNDEHTILIKVPITPNSIPECFPSLFNKKDKWDQNHVKLPCSQKNVTREQISRWDVMREAFSTRILSSQQLEAVILSYNKRYVEYWNFSALHSFFQEALDECESVFFFEGLFPKIIDLALSLPQIVTGGIPLLKRGFKHSVTLSQLQISCLLANAFLCMFPHRNRARKNSEYSDYPDINFNRLFQCDDPSRVSSVHEKLKCIINYFRRVTSAIPTGVVTYSRQLVPGHLYPDWRRSNAKLPCLYVSSSGTIEDDGFGLFQVDFANKFVGGGVIGTGCVQEEIRFVLCPELILSRLFTQCLGENEALVVTGCERYNKYCGYGSSFQWAGDYVDETPSDEYGRKYCTVLALDAICYTQNPNEQYTTDNICRDLNKAFVGFSWGSGRKREDLCGIATGNWGCGVFRGDPQLKSLLQLMAAAEVGRDLAYFTFQDVELRDSMASIHRFLCDNSVTVGQICELLIQYNNRKLYHTVRLYEYLRHEAIRDPTPPQQKEQDLPSSPKMYKIFATPKLAITKRSFCCRMKTNDQMNRVKKEFQGQADEKDGGVENELKKSELEMLASMYSSPRTESKQSPKLKPGSFDFLDQFKKKLKSRNSVQRSAASETEAVFSDEDEPFNTEITSRVVSTCERSEQTRFEMRPREDEKSDIEEETRFEGDSSIERVSDSGEMFREEDNSIDRVSDSTEEVENILDVERTPEKKEEDSLTEKVSKLAEQEENILDVERTPEERLSSISLNSDETEKENIAVDTPPTEALSVSHTPSNRDSSTSKQKFTIKTAFTRDDRQAKKDRYCQKRKISDYFSPLNKKSNNP